jgi:hypothetical protein
MSRILTLFHKSGKKMIFLGLIIGTILGFIIGILSFFYNMKEEKEDIY